MFSKIRNFYKSNLKYVGDEKLTRLSIFFILILNIFVFTVMNYGINFQTKVIHNPNTEYTYDCRDIFRKPDNILGHTNFIYTRTNYNNKYSSIKKQELSEICNNLFTKVEDVKKSIDILAYKKEYIVINNKKSTAL